MSDPRESYQSPLNSRYASPEMKYNFSEKKKFSEWRKLWVILARAQRELGVQHDGRDITEEQGPYPAASLFYLDQCLLWQAGSL